MNRSTVSSTGFAVRIPWFLLGLGVAFVLVIVAEVVVVLTDDSVPVFHDVFFVGVLTSLPFALGIAVGGYWLLLSDLSPARYPRIAKWCLGGLFIFLLINVATMLAMPELSREGVFAWIRWAAWLGAGIGLLVGVIEGRGIERAIAGERETLLNEHLQDQRDLLDYLNTILRHEVLNAATIIDGYASNLLAESQPTDEERRRWAEIIVLESRGMTAVIEDVRVLLHATEGEVRLEPVELTTLLDQEVRKLHYTYEHVEVERTGPDEVYVVADELLPRVFSNLLSNAVEHNDRDEPYVALTITSGDERVRVEIADNGPGIPEAKRRRLFERTEASGQRHGLGLYLVRKLLDRYRGTIELTETGADGSRFTVELPRADGADDDSWTDDVSTSGTEPHGSPVSGVMENGSPAGGTERGDDPASGHPDGVPADQVSADGTSGHGISTDGMAEDGVSADGVSEDGISANGTSEAGVSADGTSEADVPEQGANGEFADR